MTNQRAFTGNRYRSAEALDRWLADAGETPVEPDLAIVDAHHHLWPDGDHPYSPADLVTASAGMNIVGSVFVECGAAYNATLRYGSGFDLADPAHDQPIEETRYAAQAVQADPAAVSHGLCGAIVGFADLQQGEAAARARLETHIEAGNGRFRGIRQSAAWDPAINELSWRFPPPGLLLDHRFQSGFAALGSLGLSFDAWLYYPQMFDLVQLARKFPEIPIILNHFGGIIGVGPHQQWRAQGFAQWRHYMAELAGCPNVIMKMGGLGMPAAGFGFHFQDTPPTSRALAAQWKAWVDVAIETFGADRCMIGSNFPVERQCGEYSTLWNAYKIATADYSADERSAIFSGTARRVYRLASSQVAGG